ncbi:MAG TPA: TrkA family potassium uptake protein [Phycisphaerae bacterium]|nr:TrkA family potassium uptake protein [Phycisphaerae bacterium]
MERFAVIGMGRFGTRLARLLTEAGAEVIAVDRRKNLIEDVRDDVTRPVCLDATDEEALRSQGIDEVDVAIVGIGSNFEAAVLTTVLLKQLGVPRVISRAASNIRARILSRVGADEIVNPEQESADRWRDRLIAMNIMERIELAENFSLVQMTAPDRFTGKTLGQLDVRKNFHVQVIAIRRTAEDIDADGLKRARELVISVPMAETTIKSEDVLILIGSDEAIKEFGS